MATKHIDENGFTEYKNNKLSQVGIFEYLGSDIGAPDPAKVYRVYRPKEELSSKECIDSFNLQPWIINHKMLGNKGIPAEKKGIHGVIGENIYFDKKDNWLKGNIKAFTDRLDDEIREGKNELSLGYGCKYDFTPGSNEFGSYDVVQRNIRGNHLASVENSRMKVAVGDSINGMDSISLNINFAGDKEMKDEEKDKAKDEEKKKEERMKDEKEKETSEDEEEEEESEEESKDKKSKVNMSKDRRLKKKLSKDNRDGMDSAMIQKTIEDAVENAVKPLLDEISALKERDSAMDSVTVFQEINKRDLLAKKVSPYIGTFDHANMSLQQVSKHTVEKLNLPHIEGHEVKAVEAFLHGRKASPEALYEPRNIGQDSSSNDSSNSLAIDRYINGEI